MSEKSDEARLYGIGAVSRLTGLTDHTIRVWERRYSAVVTAKAPNGRRQYTEADVQKLALLRLLTERGVAISRIAGDTIDELGRRVESLRNLETDTQPRTLRVAVLGDFLPRQLREQKQCTARLELCIADSSRERFAADLRRQPVDVVVLEKPVLDAEALAEMQQHLSISGSARGVIVYSFGRTRDIEAAAGQGIVALRAPVPASHSAATNCATQPPAQPSRVTGRCTIRHRRRTNRPPGDIRGRLRPAASVHSNWRTWPRRRTAWTASARNTSCNWCRTSAHSRSTAIGVQTGTTRTPRCIATCTARPPKRERWSRVPWKSWPTPKG